MEVGPSGGEEEQDGKTSRQDPEEDDGGEGERSARLPEEVSLENRPIVISSPPPPMMATETPAPVPRGRMRHADLAGQTGRESLLATMGQSRTTLLELGEVARRLSVLAPGVVDARRATRQAVLSFVVALTLVLLATMVFAGGTWRLVLGIFAGTGTATLAVYGALRGVSRLGTRHGAVALPGPPILWIGGVVLVAIGTTAGFTWSLSTATESLAIPVHRIRIRAPVQPSASAAPSAAAPRADDAVQRDARSSVAGGVLWVPPGFSSEDGRFDLFIHFHGNTDLVKASVRAAKLNALVLILNYGEGSERYAKPFRNAFIFDRMLDSVEAKAAELGLQSPRVHRIALSSWSAGYGAIYQILSSRSRLDRVDAVLLMDSLHGSFVPLSPSIVHPVSLQPFVAFARRAIEGEKLMVVTHSSIETEGYASTTQATNALLETLSLQRDTDPEHLTRFDAVDLPVAVRAFPSGERNWLQVASQAKKGHFALYGCTGKGKGDHVAHLAQMSVTVLPPLVERWQPDASGSSLGSNGE